MKRSLSAPCLADEDNESKKVKSSDKETGPTSREYLQLALARVLELQRQINDDSYVTDNTSDLGESDSEEDVMKEVLTKVFKDLPGSLPSVSSIINRATQPQPRQLDVVRSKRIQLAGYETCRRVAIDFMNGVVKRTPITGEDPETFHMGTYSRADAKMADHKTGLLNIGPGETNGENSEDNNVAPRNNMGHPSQNVPETPAISSRLLLVGRIQQSSKQRNHNGLPSSQRNQILQCQFPNIHHASKNVANRNFNRNSQNVQDNTINIGNQLSRLNAIQNYDRNLQNFTEATQRQNISADYEIRVRMLRGLDLHLAAKQRDFTARLMRQ